MHKAEDHRRQEPWMIGLRRQRRQHRSPSQENPLPKLLDPEVVIPTLSSKEEEEIINSVVSGTIPSYSLELRLGDCKRATSIRREVLQKTQINSLMHAYLNLTAKNQDEEEVAEHRGGARQEPVRLVAAGIWRREAVEGQVG
jgi:hypothetical protein